MVSPPQVNDIVPRGECCKEFSRPLVKEATGCITQDTHHGIMADRNDNERAKQLHLTGYGLFQGHLQLLRKHGRFENTFHHPSSHHYWGLPQQRTVPHDHHRQSLAAAAAFTAMVTATIPTLMSRREFIDSIPTPGCLEGMMNSTDKMIASHHNNSNHLPLRGLPYPFWGVASVGQSHGTSSSCVPSKTIPTFCDGNIHHDKLTNMTPHGGIPTKVIDRTSKAHTDIRGSAIGESPQAGSMLVENHYIPTARTRTVKGYDDDEYISAIMVQPPFSPATVSTNDGTIHRNDGGKNDKAKHQQQVVRGGVTTMKVRTFSPDIVQSKEVHNVIPVPSGVDLSSPPPLTVLSIKKKKPIKKTIKINKTRVGMPPITELSIPVRRSPPPPPPTPPTPVVAGSSKAVFTSTVLYQGDDDDEYLTPYQCELRKHLEVFVASPDDVRASASPGRTGLVKLGQVGIRCRHCAATCRPHLANRMGGAAYYSKTIAGMYQIAQNMTKGHLSERCYYVPRDVQKRLTVLRKDNRRAERGKEYWSKSIEAMGVYESTKEGILRVRTNSPNVVTAQIDVGPKKELL